MTYQPLIDDPEHIKALDRQRFVVLRPGSAVSEIHDGLQKALRQRLSGSPASYPLHAHVTLAGFAAGAPLELVQELVEGWARRTPPLRIDLEGITLFPPPFQIVATHVRRTPDLFAAFADLLEAADEQRLPLSITVPAEEWGFHMTLAHCSKLTRSAWNDVSEFTRMLNVPPAWCEVNQAEIIAFDGGEYSGGIYSLQGRRG